MAGNDHNQAKKTEANEGNPGEKVSSSGDNGSEKDFLVVALGASAGGVRALQEFFASMPPNSGMAFVVILHLSPEHESNLASVLQTQTSMPVIQVRETHKVEPDTVYVIPPNQNLEMTDGVVRLAEPEKKTGQRVAIDVFFRTLAEVYARNAVCIVLSGTGADGTLGLKRVKESNGFAIVQDPLDADFQEMPRSAIATGLADWILPVGQMPEKLIGFRESSDRMHLTDGDDRKVAHEIQAEQSLREILTLLRVRTGHDFSNYKTPTLVRRIARHLQIHELEDIPSYLAFLRENSDEIIALQRNLLINVTNFFRDKEAFEALEREVIPRLFDEKSSRDTVRVWCAGCASGEEAYSLAILLHEFAETLSDPPKLQVFATDVDDEAINQARENYYPDTIKTDVSEDRLRRYFAKEGVHYRLKKEIRETVLFAPHNLLRDPPFSKLDLVTCRNVLIYLNRDTQESLMEIFHFALSYNGFLFLGTSESAENVPALFSVVDKKHRIYARRPTQSSNFTPPRMPVVGQWQVNLPASTTRPKKGESAFSLGEVHLKLLEKFAPPSVLLNQDFEVLYMSEDATRYFTLKGGEPSRNIFKLINPDLLPDLRAALFTAQRERRDSEFQNISVVLDGVEKFVGFSVRVVSVEDENRDFLLVVFDEEGIERFSARGKKTGKPAAKNAAKKQSDLRDSVVERLEEELHRTKDNLRATIEQHEISTEEIKASNEELQAINEELRSASEELETSKEEAQSVNEELTTVNYELKEKIDEATRTNSDLQNLMASTDIATIFLDKALRIKRYTPLVENIFNITMGDIGRPLEHFTHRLEYEKLSEDAALVLRSLRPTEREVPDKKGRFYLARLLPYRTVEDKIDGVVINFLDITERKQTERAVIDDLRDTQVLREISAQLVVEGNIQAIYDKVLAAAIEMAHADAGTVQILDEATQQLVLFAAKNFPTAMTEHFARVDAGSKTSCGIALKKGERTFVDYDAKGVKDKDGSIKMHLDAGFVSAQSTPLVSRSGKPIGMVSTHWRERYEPSERQLQFLDLLARQASDLIERRRSDEARRESEEKLRLFVSATSDAVYEMSADWRELYYLYGKKFISTTEKPRRDWMDEYIPDDERARVRAAIDRSIATKSIFELEYLVKRLDGRVGWAFSRAVPFLNEAGKIVKWFGTASDVTERKHAESALRESEEEYRTLFNSIDQAFCTIEVIFDQSNQPVDYRFLDVNAAFESQTGIKNGVGKRMREIAPEHEDFWFETYGRVALSGEPEHFEHEAAKLGRYYEVYAFRIGDAAEKRVGILFNDIQRRRSAERLQRESEERLRIAVEAARMATWDWDLKTNEIIWNEQHFLLFGITPVKEAQRPETFFKYVHPDDKDWLSERLNRAIETNTAFEAEFRVIREDGNARWMEGYGHVVETENAKPVRMSGVMSDITSRKRAEQAVRQSEERLQLIMQSITDYAVITSDPQGIINGWNTGAENTFGWTAKEAVGQPCALIFTPEDRAAGVPELEMRTAIENGFAEDTRWHIRKDGTRFFASGTVSPIRNGEFDGFVKITSDQTDRMAAQKALQEKELLEKLVSAQEDERKRIARDLHDELGQQLVALRLKLQTAKELSKDDIIRGKLDEMQLIARKIDDGVDFLAWELRPSVLDDLGLFVALDKYVIEWSHYSGVRAELLKSSLKKTRFLPEVETNLYRIVQEALNNVHKHAKAKRVEIVFEKRENFIILIIEDNGEGFDPQNIDQSKGMGLTGIRERVGLIGGTVEFESAPGEGTTVFVRVPVESAEERKTR